MSTEAWESGSQIEVYRRHAARLAVRPVVLTLGRSRIRSDTAYLTWTDIAQGIRTSPAAHYTWRSLDEFLAEQRVVKPSLPPEPISDPAPFFEVIVGVNGRLRVHWPGTGNALAWRDGSLRSALEKAFKESHSLTTIGGPLHYGLVPVAHEWEWALEIRTENDGKVSLRSEEILRAAELGRLSSDGLRYGGRKEVLVRRLPRRATTSDHEALMWFDEGLRQLRDARILESYLSALAAKQAKD